MKNVLLLNYVNREKDLNINKKIYKNQKLKNRSTISKGGRKMVDYLYIYF